MKVVPGQPSSDRCSALLLGLHRSLHHFEGVAEALESRGALCRTECFQTAPARVTPEAIQGADVLVHADGVDAHSIGVRHAARRAGRPLALLMDGVLEYANTFLNPRAGSTFLRPAPGDVVLAAGPHDRAILGALGNRAIATGLPRLSAFARAFKQSASTIAGEYLLVATANQPSFTPAGRRRVLASLSRLRDAARHRGLAVRWRIGHDMADALGIQPDREPLLASLRGAHAVLTTASTLALEAMLASRPTAILHPHPWPLWLPCARLWRGQTADGLAEDRERMHALNGSDAAANEAAARSCELSLNRRAPLDTSDLDEVLDSMLARDASRLGLQAEALRRCCRADADQNIARAVEALARHAPAPRRERAALRIAAPSAGTLRVVSIIESQSSSVGGVSSWSARLEQYFETHPELGIDWRTLFIGPAAPAACEHARDRARAHACLIDPTDSVVQQVSSIAQRLDELRADVVIPNYGELSHAAAMHHRGSRGRVVAVAHTNDAYYRRMLDEYHAWDGAIAVSESCVEWVRETAQERPVEHIDYGVPLHAARAESRDDTAPLRLAYIGRVVEQQKRVSDLLRLLDELERLGADYEFHIVGDGDALEGWLHEAEHRRLPMRKIRIHGAKTRDWVQEFLRTLDLCVLASEAEGTSITMLESMAAGAVPCVTRVDATIDALLTGGGNAIVVPVGEMTLMARGIAALAADRAELRRLGRAAQQTIRQSSYTVEVCATRYASFLKHIAALPPARKVRTDLGLHAPSITALGQASIDLAQLATHLRAAGASDIATGHPTATSDTVIIRAEDEHPGADQLRAWRASGLGVAVEPTLSLEAHTHITHSFERLRETGCRRIAVHLDQWVLPASVEWLAKHRRESLVCILHPRAQRAATMLGIPAMTITRAASELRLDGVVLSGAYHDLAGYAATRPLRRAGARCLVLPDDSAVRDHIDAIMDQAQAAARSGGLVVSTVADIVDGARSIEIGSLLREPEAEQRPDMILLAGGDADFASFLALRALRTRGTRIHSLRWPDAELSAPERFIELIASLGTNTPYAIYGGGLHTQRLLGLASGTQPPRCVIDDRATPSSTLAGVPLVPPTDPAVKEVRAIVLSSTRFERRLWEQTASHRAAGISVFPLYASAGALAHQNRGIPAPV